MNTSARKAPQEKKAVPVAKNEKETGILHTLENLKDEAVSFFEKQIEAVKEYLHGRSDAAEQREAKIEKTVSEAVAKGKKAASTTAAKAKKTVKAVRKGVSAAAKTAQGKAAKSMDNGAKAMKKTVKTAKKTVKGKA